MSLKKSIAFLTAVGAAVALVLFASSALAQDATPATDMSWNEFGNQLGKVIDDWRTIGFIAGLVALINLLVLFMRFKPLNEWLERKGLKWIKVYAAAGLGALLTFITSYQTGAGWPQSLILGLGFGLTAVGAHQVKTARKKEKEANPEKDG